MKRVGTISMEYLLRTKIERHLAGWMYDPARDMYFVNELFMISIRD